MRSGWSRATGCELHLVEPLGFDLSEPKLRRAGLDYHDLASVTVHPDLTRRLRGLGRRRRPASSPSPHTPRRRSPTFPTVPGDVLMFGPGAHRPRPGDAERPPHHRAGADSDAGGRRSLNLSNAAAVAVYEAWRQQGFPGASEPTYQLSQWVNCSAGSRLAGRKSVPLVYAMGNRPGLQYLSNGIPRRLGGLIFTPPG